MNKINRKGFTLVELLAVIVILAIIMLIAIPAVLNTMETARRKAFTEYVDKVYLTTQKQVIEDEISGITIDGCKTYYIKKDIGLNNTGSYDGYVLVKRDGFNPDTYYITMHDDNYKIDTYLYDGSLKAEDLVAYTKGEEFDFSCTVAGCKSCSSDENLSADEVCSTLTQVNDSTPGSFSGSGTLYDPYKIESIEDLDALSKGTNDGSLSANKYYKLMLDLSYACDKSYADPTSGLKTELTTGTGWTPIGTNANPFKSTILGNNNKIYGLYINSTATSGYYGFIGSAMVDNNQDIIKDISFLDSDVKSSGLASAIVVARLNNTGSKGIIDNITTSGKIECTSSNCGSVLGRAEYESKQDISNIVNKATFISNRGDSGGVIGYANYGTIKNIYNYGDVTIKNGWSGGVFGSTGKGLDVESIYNYGNVNSSGCSYTAAVFGYFQNGTINKAYNYGNIVCTSGYCGGIVGGSWNDSSYRNLFISNIYNYGNVSGAADTMGGCNGKLTYTHEINAYNFGNVTFDGEWSSVGGVVGHVNGYALLYNAGNNGTVSVTSNDYTRVGGVVGYGEGTISNVYNTGNITTTRKSASRTQIKIGGLVGNGSCKNCYSIGNIDLNGTIDAAGNNDSDQVGLGFGETNTKNLSNVFVVGKITNNINKTSWGNNYGAIAGYFSSSYSEDCKNYYAKAEISGIPSVGLMGGGIVSWTDKYENFYVDLDTDANKVSDGVSASSDQWDKYYYNLKNVPAEKKIDFVRAYDFTQVNDNWFKNTLNLGNNFKYESGKYPKLYKLLPNGSTTSELLDGQKDIAIK